MLPFYFIKKSSILKNKLAKMYADRAYQIVPKIVPALSKKDNILDIGCGTGVISKILKKEYGLNITLVDVDYNQMCDSYPVIIYDGVKLPFKNKQFSTSLILTVLHHAKSSDAVLDEAIRVTKDKIIVMEDIFTDFPSRVVTFIGDCLVNFEIHSPFRNLTKESWIKIFEKKDLKILSMKEFKLRCVGFPFRLAVFVLQVPNKKSR